MNSSIDPKSIAEVDLGQFCPECPPDEGHRYVKATSWSEGKQVYLVHNKCGWCKILDIDWESYVKQKIDEGFVLHPKSPKTIIGQWDLKPWMFDSVKSKKGCFIATAVFGNTMAPEVLYLRRYRNIILNKSIHGRAFVHLYYLLSPPIARVISKSIVLKALTREIFLKPIIKLLSHLYPVQSLNKRR